MKKQMIGVLGVLFAVKSMAAVICYDSHATGADTGVDWENACTNLSVAFEKAGDGGEVRVRQGIHFPIPVVSGAAIDFPNVRLVGGYTGSGDARSTDPRTTIFSGDIDRDDCYKDAEGTDVGAVLNYETGAFIDFMNTTVVGHWVYTPKKTNVNALFKVADAVVSDYGQRLEGITFTGFGRGNGNAILNGGWYAHAVVTNCHFIGINSYLRQWQPASLNFKCDARITGCKFLGMLGTPIRYVKDTLKTTSTELLVADCEFAYSYGGKESPVSLGYVSAAKNGHSKVLGCSFHDLFLENTYNSDINSICVMTENGFVDLVADCTFRRITGVGDVSGVIYANNTGCCVTNCTFESCRIDAREANKDRDHYSLVYAYKGVDRCSFSNCLFTTTRETASTTLVRSYTGSGLYAMNCDFIDCAVTAAVKFAALTYYSYKNPDRQAIVSGNSICGATKASLAGAGGTLSFSLGGAIVGNVISAGTDDAQFGHYTTLSKVSVVGNRLSTASGSNVYFTPSLASVHSCSIAQNELSGGSAKVTLAGGSAFSICNSEVIGNKLSGAGDAAVCAILSLSASKDAASVLWSKIYGNDVSTGVYVQQLDKVGTVGYLNLNSSVFARDEGTLPFTPVAYADDAYADYFQIRFRESHLQNADAAAKYVDTSSTVGGVLQLLTDAPQVWPKTQTSADGFPYLRLASRSPYRKLAYRPFNVSSTDTQYTQVVFEETSGVWKYAYNLSKYTPTGSEVALGDLLGASRAEGDVRLGAIQEVQKLGLAVLVR